MRVTSLNREESAATKLQRLFRKRAHATHYVETEIKRHLLFARSLVCCRVSTNDKDNAVERCAKLRSVLRKGQHYDEDVVWTTVDRAMIQIRSLGRILKDVARKHGAHSLSCLVRYLTRQPPPSFVERYDPITRPIGYTLTYEAGDGTDRLEPSSRSSTDLGAVDVRIHSGACVYTIHCQIEPDPDHLIMEMVPFQRTYQQTVLNLTGINHSAFAVRILDSMLVRDILVLQDIPNYIRECQVLAREQVIRSTVSILNDFMGLSLDRRHRILVSLCAGGPAMRRKARYVYSRFVLSASKPDIHNLIVHFSQRVRDELLVDECHDPVPRQQPRPTLSYEDRIHALDISDSAKKKALEKLRQMKVRDQDGKARHYLDGLLRIPFGKIREEPIFGETRTLKVEINALLELEAKPT